MTEREFDDCIERVADKFEKKITKGWNEQRIFRLGARSVSVAVEGLLIVKAIQEIKVGNKTTALWCFGLGATGLLFEVARLIVFEKE